MTPRLPRRSLALVLALAAPLGLLACSDDEPDRAEVRSEPATADDPGNGIGGDAGDETPQGDAGGASGAGGSTGSRDDVLGTAPGAHPAAPSNPTIPLRVDVNSIRRTSGDLVEVLFTITNDGDLDYEPYATLGEDSGSYDVSGATLLDAPNDTRYLVVFDSADGCLCTEDLAALSVAPGDTVPFEATFPAPPEDVTTVGFDLPGFDLIDGLEIS